MWRAIVGIMSLRLNRLRTRLGLDNSRRTSCLVRAGGASPGWFRSPRQSARLTTLVMPARCLGSRRDHCFAVTRSFDDRAVAYESQRIACRAADEPILIAVDEFHGKPHPIAGRPQSHWRGLRFHGLGSSSWSIDQNTIDLGALLRFSDIIKSSHFML